MDNADEVKKLLGGDLRLHAALVGTESEALKRVATTYRVFG